MCSLNTSIPDYNILYTVEYDHKLQTFFQKLYFSDAFSTPRLWNDLHMDLRLHDSLFTFCKKLKTHHFAQYTLNRF